MFPWIKPFLDQYDSLLLRGRDLDLSHPELNDLKQQAKRRLPLFAFEYLDSATGREMQMRRNREALDNLLFDTRILQGELEFDLSGSVLGQNFDLPFGIAPVGMAGMIWPGAERQLAQAAQRHNIPYGLSTVSTQLPEDMRDHIGNNGWFQLYSPKDPEIRRDMCKRAKASGFHTLVVTVDVQADSRRERQRRANLTMPPKITPFFILQCLLNLRWSAGILGNGIPRLALAESYLDTADAKVSVHHAGHIIRGRPDWDYLRELRQEWDGPMAVKGVNTAEDAVALEAEGVDAIWVSNHSARQFDGGFAAIDTLPPIKAALKPDTQVIFDSGVETGLDVIRALAAGADFVMMGRAFYYAIAAFGTAGVDHLIHILREDMKSNLGQMGVARPKDAADLLFLQD